MDQIININLLIRKEDREYLYVVRPGYSWDEMLEVLAEFKAEVEILRAVAEAQKRDEPVQS